MGDARGMVEMTRETPSSEDGGEGVGEVKRKKNEGFFGAVEGGEGSESSERVRESHVLESRDAGLGAGDVPGKAGLEELDFSHAARVEASTGHASAGISDSFAIVVWLEAVFSVEDIYFSNDEDHVPVNPCFGEYLRLADLVGPSLCRFQTIPNFGKKDRVKSD
jgi:hypothetical protein